MLQQLALEIIKNGEKKTMLPPYQPEQGHYHEVIATETDKVHLNIHFIGGFCSYEYSMNLESDAYTLRVFRFIDDRQEKAAQELVKFLEI